MTKGLLDDEERDRLAALRTPAARTRFMGAHTGLRLLLSSHLRTPPHQLAFGRDPCPLCDGPHGRPVLHDHLNVHFSMSYRDGIAAYAIASRPVGIDIEATDRPVTLEDLSAALHPREEAEIATLPGPEQRTAALSCWVRKEAYLKGTGTGLGRDPSTIYVGMNSQDHPPGWSVADVPVDAHHVAAIAVQLA